MVFINLVFSVLLQLHTMNGTSTFEVLNYIFWAFTLLFTLAFPIKYSILTVDYVKTRN